MTLEQRVTDLERLVFLMEKTRAAELRAAKKAQRDACEAELAKYVKQRMEVTGLSPDPFFLGVVLSRRIVRGTRLVRSKR